MSTRSKTNLVEYCWSILEDSLSRTIRSIVKRGDFTVLPFRMLDALVATHDARAIPMILRMAAAPWDMAIDGLWLLRCPEARRLIKRGQTDIHPFVAERWAFNIGSGRNADWMKLPPTSSTLNDREAGRLAATYLASTELERQTAHGRPCYSEVAFWAALLTADDDYVVEHALRRLIEMATMPNEDNVAPLLESTHSPTVRTLAAGFLLGSKSEVAHARQMGEPACDSLWSGFLSPTRILHVAPSESDRDMLAKRLRKYIARNPDWAALPSLDSAEWARDLESAATKIENEKFDVVVVGDGKCAARAFDDATALAEWFPGISVVIFADGTVPLDTRLNVISQNDSDDSIAASLELTKRAPDVRFTALIEDAEFTPPTKFRSPHCVTMRLRAVKARREKAEFIATMLPEQFEKCSEALNPGRTVRIEGILCRFPGAGRGELQVSTITKV